MKILDWWLDHITFAPFDLNMKLMDVVSEFAGDTAALGAMALMIPVTMVLICLCMLSTIIPMVLAVAYLPFGLLIAIVKKLRGVQ